MLPPALDLDGLQVNVPESASSKHVSHLPAHHRILLHPADLRTRGAVAVESPGSEAVIEHLNSVERQARSVSPLITGYDSASISIVESADRYEVSYVITVRINKNFITLNVGVTVPVGTI